MTLTKRSIVFIVLLIVCALIMTLEFGGNYDTFYEWLSGEGGFGHSRMPDDSLFTVLAWIYLVTLIATVFFEVICQYDFMQLCAYISFGSIAVIFAFGLYGTAVTSFGPLCIGMPLLFSISTAILILAKKWKPSTSKPTKTEEELF